MENDKLKKDLAQTKRDLEQAQRELERALRKRDSDVKVSTYTHTTMCFVERLSGALVFAQIIWVIGMMVEAC